MGNISADFNVNKLITQFALDFKPMAFVADDMFPGIPVMKTVGKYLQYSREWQRRPADAKELSLRSRPGVEAPVIELDATTKTYNLHLYRLAGIVDEEDRSNADGPLTAERFTTEQVTRRIMLEKEIQVKSLITTTGNYLAGNTSDISTNNVQWNVSTSTGSNSPVSVVLSAVTTMMDNGSTMPPDNMWVGYDVYNVLLAHKEIRDRISSDQDKTIQRVRSLLASIFGVENFHIVWATQNTAQSGATDSFSAVVSDKAGLYKLPRSTVDFGFASQFQKSGFPNADSFRRRERMNAQTIEVRDWFEFNSVSNLGGFLFFDVLS